MWSVSSDGKELVGVLPLGVLGVGLLYGEDTRSVYLLHLDAPGAMDDSLLVYQDTHMGDSSFVGIGFAEESQITGLGLV